MWGIATLAGQTDRQDSRFAPLVCLLVIAGTIGVALVLGSSAGVGAQPASEGASIDAQNVPGEPSIDAQNVTEEAYVEIAPTPGDPYFEAEDADGEWISYENPRDEYRSPYLGEGSGKICVSVYNEAGEPIVGTTVPNTTVTIPTGEDLEWHSHADPMTVAFPLVEHYERPLDADQFGTSPDLPQGDGYLDAHCIEFHGMGANSTVSYGEVEITGEYADRLTVVGYVEVTHTAWESDVDPLEDARPYANISGGWTYGPEESHGQVVAVLQLDPTVAGPETGSEDTGDAGRQAGETDADGQDETEDDTRSDTSDTTGDEQTDTGSDIQAPTEEADSRDGTESDPGIVESIPWRWAGLGLFVLLAGAVIFDRLRQS